MELFYSNQIEGDTLLLDSEESGHCVRVLRHRPGDRIDVIDGCGTLYHCELVCADARGASARILGTDENFGSHPYRLTMAVCPTKNSDRYEWFAEKATEVGVDVIVPVIGEHSERKVLKTERLDRIVKSAAKQSLKGTIPNVSQSVSVRDFILAAPESALKMICYCFEGEKHSIPDILPQAVGFGPENHGRPWPCEREGPAPAGVGGMSEAKFSGPKPTACGRTPDIQILIGPEGDFSQAEAQMALDRGWIPVTLGNSRLRTETAALVAVTQVYTCMGD